MKLANQVGLGYKIIQEDVVWGWNKFKLVLSLIILHLILGFQDDGDKEHWGTLGRGMMTLFILVTGDGWTGLESILREKGIGLLGNQRWIASVVWLQIIIYIN